MAEGQPVTTSLIPSLATELAKWFPEMGGRFIAVSEIEPFDNVTNVPRLPIGFVALLDETGKGDGNVELTDDIVVHFSFEPVKYKSSDGQDTPFYAYYDFEPVRDKLLTFTRQWRSPRGVKLSYRSLVVDANEYAVTLLFRFNATVRWCEPEELAAKPVEFDITTRVCAPKSTVPCIKPSPEPEDPCHAARLRNPHGRENWDEETKRQHQLKD